MSIWNRLYTAPLTPMRPDGELNLAAVEPLATMLLHRGTEGLYVCGGTGEGALLTVDERMALVERWVEVIGRSVPIVVHVGHTCLNDARALARHAGTLGIAAISAMGPMYPPAPVRDMDGLLRWSAAIAEAAPHLPFLYYHFGYVAGMPRVHMAEYMPRAIERIPNFAGIKFTHEDLMDFGRCLQFANGTFAALYGRDEMMLPALVSGARGFAGGTFNLTMPLAARICQAYRASDLERAQRYQQQLQNLIVVLQRYGGLPALKAAMAVLGLDMGPARQPWCNVEGQQLTRLTREIERAWPDVSPQARPADRTPQPQPRAVG